MQTRELEGANDKCSACLLSSPGMQLPCCAARLTTKQPVPAHGLQQRAIIRSVLRRMEFAAVPPGSQCLSSIITVTQSDQNGGSSHLGLLNENLILPFKSAKNYKR